MDGLHSRRQSALLCQKVYPGLAGSVPSRKRKDPFRRSGDETRLVIHCDPSSSHWLIVREILYSMQISIASGGVPQRGWRQSVQEFARVCIQFCQTTNSPKFAPSKRWPDSQESLIVVTTSISVFIAEGCTTQKFIVLILTACLLSNLYNAVVPQPASGVNMWTWSTCIQLITPKTCSPIVSHAIPVVHQSVDGLRGSSYSE